MRVTFYLNREGASVARAAMEEWLDDNMVQVRYLDHTEANEREAYNAAVVRLVNTNGNRLTLHLVESRLVYEGRRGGVHSPSVSSILEAVGALAYYDGSREPSLVERVRVETSVPEVPWYEEVGPEHPSHYAHGDWVEYQRWSSVSSRVEFDHRQADGERLYVSLGEGETEVFSPSVEERRRYSAMY